MSTLRYRVISPSGIHIGEDFYGTNEIVRLTAVGAKYFLINRRIVLASAQAPASDPGGPNEDNVEIDIRVDNHAKTVSLTTFVDLFPSGYGKQGPMGPQGPTGSKGDKGDAGRGITLMGWVENSAGLPTGSSDGDVYVAKDTGHGWARTNSTWIDIGQFRGPKGDQGLVGPAGPMGQQGPQGEKGVQGDPGDPSLANLTAGNASSAASSATAANNSATSASSFATASSTSAIAAATSESNALAHKHSAATSASNAATSESNALASKNAAATSEANAKTSETNTKTSETNAKASETNAATSATSAASAANAAVQDLGGIAAPLGPAAAAVGTSTKWAREDHRHPVDTATADARVAAAAGTATPTGAGTAAVGTSTKWAHEDHVHPTDTSRAPTANPNFSGTISLGGTNFVLKASGYTQISNGDGSQVAFLAGSIDPANYYRNSTHYFQGIGGSGTFAYLDAAGLHLTGPLYVNGGYGVRKQLTANTTYYVRTDGNDGNDGLSNTAGGAFLTITKALQVVGGIDCGAYQLIISVQAGTYTVAISLPRMVAAVTPILQGVGSTTIINTTLDAITNDGGTPWAVNNMKIVSTGSSLVTRNGGLIRFQGIEFGAAGGNGHLLAFANSTIVGTGNYSISGGGGFHMLAVGYIDVSGVTVTILAPVSFAGSFAYSNSGLGYIRAYGNTYVNPGNVTGKRYQADGNSYTFTSGGGANYFPGTVAGTTSGNGIYS